MVIVIALAAAVIVVATTFAAKGMGGEMARFPRDLPEFMFRPRSSADLMSLELPVGLFGFQEQATASALNALGRLLAAREAEVEHLRAEIARIGGGQAPGGPSDSGWSGGGGPGGSSGPGSPGGSGGSGESGGSGGPGGGLGS